MMKYDTGSCAKALYWLLILFNEVLEIFVARVFITE